MTWEKYNPQPEFNDELEALGSKLSVEIGCPIRYPAYGKHMFECRCGVVFPLYILRGGDWPAIIRKHIEERKLIKA